MLILRGIGIPLVIPRGLEICTNTVLDHSDSKKALKTSRMGTSSYSIKHYSPLSMEGLTVQGYRALQITNASICKHLPQSYMT